VLGLEIISKDVLNGGKLEELINDRFVLQGISQCGAESSWMWERKSPAEDGNQEGRS
jgi:hypothetical protein